MYSPYNQESNLLISTLSVISFFCIHLSTAVFVSPCLVSSIPHRDSFLFLSDFLPPSPFSRFSALPASTKLSDLLGVVRRGSGPATDGEGSTSTPSPTPQTPNIPMQSKYKAGAIPDMWLYVCVHTWLERRLRDSYIYIYIFCIYGRHGTGCI